MPLHPISLLLFPSAGALSFGVDSDIRPGIITCSFNGAAPCKVHSLSHQNSPPCRGRYFGYFSHSCINYYLTELSLPVTEDSALDMVVMGNGAEYFSMDGSSIKAELRGPKN